MKGYNLPDNVSPSDPEAPWNEVEGDWEPVFTCQRCGREFESLEDMEACKHTCYACHEEV
jgi:hypothetical protein